MRRLSRSALDQINARALVPLDVLEFSLTPPYTTFELFFVANTESVLIDGRVYTALGFRRETIDTSTTYAADKTTLGLDDVDERFTALIDASALVGARVRVLTIFYGVTETMEDAIPRFDGFCGGPSINDDSVTVEIRSVLSYRNVLLPNRFYSADCGYFFGGSLCGVDLTAAKNFREGTAESGSRPSVLRSSVLFGQPANYWIGGYVRLLDGPEVGTVRPVRSSAPGKVILEVPFNSDLSGRRFKIVRGCRKTKNDCNGHDNLDAYGGFAEVPRTPALDRVVGKTTTGGGGK